MRALILGGTGMLGHALVAEARARGEAALALSHEQADITRFEHLRGWVESFRPDTVFNCAAYTKVDACEGEGRAAACEVNGRAVAGVVAAAELAGARLIQISTDYVFDGEARQPYREDAPAHPLSVYGESKLAGEREALRSERALVVRTSWLFGPGGSNFVATVVRLIDEERLPLRMVRDQEGCPTYTPFLAKALLDLAAGGLTGIVHYRNREPVSWYAFALEIARLWSGNLKVEVVPVTTDEFPRPASRPAYSVLDVSRFEETLGRPVEPWGWGLADYLTGLRKRRTS